MTRPSTSWPVGRVHAITHTDGAKSTFEFGEGAFFAIPLNAMYQFHNGSGTQPCRYFSVTNLPGIMRQFRNEDFIFNCPFDFKDRFGGQDNYFDGQGKLWRGRSGRPTSFPTCARCVCGSGKSVAVAEPTPSS